MQNDNDMAGRIMAHAFNDELEKIAGLPRALKGMSSREATKRGLSKEVVHRIRLKEIGGGYRKAGVKPTPDTGARTSGGLEAVRLLAGRSKRQKMPNPYMVGGKKHRLYESGRRAESIGMRHSAARHAHALGEPTNYGSARSWPKNFLRSLGFDA
jgi:hypothetical protein